MAFASRAAAAAVACVLLALAASAAGASSHAHAPAPAPAVDCVAQATSLIDCLDYVSQGSTTPRPSAKCCGEVKTAVANPTVVACLCSLAGGGSQTMGFPIDMKRVLALPGACGASTDAFSKCHITAGSPTEAPAPSTGGSTSGGSAAAPPHAAASSPRMTATALVAAVVAPLLAYCSLF